MIPLLPCHAINPMLEFYQTLGFEVTYQQSKPNTYAVVCYGKIELHFFTMPQYEPANSYSTCYVRVSNVDGLYQIFMAGLRQHYGRVPWIGIPRLLPLKNKTGRREFIIVDPGGNWIRIGQAIETIVTDDASVSKTTNTKLSKALDTATSLWDAGHEDKAATLLDVALARDVSTSARERVQALIYRAGMAITMGDLALARRLLDEAGQIPLRDDERATLADDLQRADELEAML